MRRRRGHIPTSQPGRFWGLAGFCCCSCPPVDAFLLLSPASTSMTSYEDQALWNQYSGTKKLPHPFFYHQDSPSTFLASGSACEAHWGENPKSCQQKMDLCSKWVCPASLETHLSPSDGLGFLLLLFGKICLYIQVPKIRTKLTSRWRNKTKSSGLEVGSLPLPSGARKAVGSPGPAFW